MARVIDRTDRLTKDDARAQVNKGLIGSLAQGSYGEPMDAANLNYLYALRDDVRAWAGAIQGEITRVEAAQAARAEEYVLKLTDPVFRDFYVERGSFGWRWTTELRDATLFTRDHAEAFRDQGGELERCELAKVALLDDGGVEEVAKA